MDLQTVQNKLQRAVELELSTIPPYLTAWFSIPPGTNQEAASIIRSVFMEEMLHMILAANVLTAVGGKSKLNKNTIPTYPLHLDFEDKLFKEREFQVNLEKLSPSALCTFLQIELPGGWDWENNHPKACKKQAIDPEDMEFEVSGLTIGDFYNEIKGDLKTLVEMAHGDESKVFIGDPSHQVDVNYYWKGGGLPVIVDNLKSAFQAIDEITEQGEGATAFTVLDGDKKHFEQRAEVAHFYRFNEILMERYYRPDDDPRLPPTGGPVDVDYSKVSPTKPNCTSIDFMYTPVLERLNNEFNYTYTLMLKQLEKGLTGQPKVLYTAIMNGMHSLAPIAYQMAQIPIYQDPENRTGSPSFEWVDNLPV